jgi:hypothetical protein
VFFINRSLGVEPIRTELINAGIVVEIHDDHFARDETRQFWLTLRSTALPYNLLVLQKLTAATAMTFQNNFGTAWLPQYNELLGNGRLYGIDMTIFSGLDPYRETNGTLRFTPSTMTLLEMDDRKNLNPIAVCVADANDINDAQTYVPSSPAWIYGLLVAKHR